MCFRAEQRVKVLLQRIASSCLKARGFTPMAAATLFSSSVARGEYLKSVTNLLAPVSPAHVSGVSKLGADPFGILQMYKEVIEWVFDEDR